MYVIKKGALYVAKPGGAKSYTDKLECAEVFNTSKEAAKSKCGNEYVAKVELWSYVRG